MLDTQLAELAYSYGIDDPPEVELERFVSQAEVADVRMRCLVEAGFAVQVSEDGQGIEANVPGDQIGAYNLAAYVCTARFPIRPGQTGPLTDEQKDAAFEYLTETLVACLDQHGYTIAEIPTRETFLATFDTAPWNPYTQLANTDFPRSLLMDCPSNPPPEVLYGE